MPYSTPDFADSNIASAAQWIEQLLFGSLGMAIAILAVGLIGFRMLLGYSSPRAMGRILLGCFILFGAPAIARALTGGARDQVPMSTYASETSATPSSRIVPQMPSPSTNPFDPYAIQASSH